MPFRRCLPLLLTLAFTAAGPLPGVRGEDLAQRLKALEPGKWADWLAMAADLEKEKKEKPVAAARILYEACARAGDEESSRTALRKLAELQAGTAPWNDAGAAAGLLLELARRSGSDEVLARVEKLRSETVQTKKALFDSASKAVGEKRYPEAEDCLRRALLLPFDLTPEVGERVTEETAFARLAEVSRLRDEAWTVRFEGKNPVCARCTGGSVQDCPECKGKGKVRRAEPVAPGPDGRPRPPEYGFYPCTRCGGWGQLRCAACQATGFDLRLLTPPDAQAFAEFAKAASRCIREDDIEEGLSQAQDWALKLALDLPGPFKPEDESVWELFPIRGRTRIPAKFESAWDAPSSSVARMNLVIDYGVVTARALSPYRPMAALSRTARTEKNLRPAWLSTVPLPPERIAAFPSFHHDRWCAVIGTYGGRRNLPEFRQAEAVTVAGAAPHGITFVVWEEGAQKETHALAALGSPFASLAAFSTAYPFRDLPARIEAMREGEKVEVLGRFLYREERAPRLLFEIWWAGTPGLGPVDPGDPEPEKTPEGPRPSPGPLLSVKEEWILRTNDNDRLIAMGNGYFRTALEREGKSSSWEDFPAENERTLESLQKARACYDKAWSRDQNPGIAQSILLVNRRILARIEAARAR